VEAKASLNYARISCRKVKIVLDIIKNKPVAEALAILKHTPKAASELVYKLVASAAANAENNLGMSKDNLFVAACFADQGPTLKRVMPRAQGRAFRILKRTSHITVVLDARA
jgi:large subunit ribosomal protein L22